MNPNNIASNDSICSAVSRQPTFCTKCQTSVAELNEPHHRAKKIHVDTTRSTKDVPTKMSDRFSY